MTCFVSKPSRITLVELSIINTSYQKLPFGSGDYPESCLWKRSHRKAASIHSTLPSKCKKVRPTSSSKYTDAAHPSCDSPNTSRFASHWVLVMNSDAHLADENPTLLRAPPRHCRDGRVVYGHTTTAMHTNEYTPSPNHPKPKKTKQQIL